MKLSNGKVGLCFFISLVVMVVGLIFYPPEFFTAPSASIRTTQKTMQYDFRGIARDSENRLYVGFYEGIFVYSPLGEFLHRLHLPTDGGSYDYYVEDDIITAFISRTDKKIELTFDGSVIDESEHENDESYRKLDEPKTNQRKVYENGELTYKYHSVIYYWWVTDGNGRFVAGCPIVITLIKLALTLLNLCWIAIVIRIFYAAGIRNPDDSIYYKIEKLFLPKNNKKNKDE